MDTSEQYIKMCDCPEIQEKSEVYNDRCCFWASRLIDGSFSIWADLHSDNSRWLPRQDQIQEMMGYSHPRLAIEPFAIYRSHNQWNHLETWEQLWLAFYMLENHQKIWNGDKWIKSETE